MHHMLCHLISLNETEDSSLIHIIPMPRHKEIRYHQWYQIVITLLQGDQLTMHNHPLKNSFS